MEYLLALLIHTLIHSKERYNGLKFYTLYQGTQIPGPHVAMRPARSIKLLKLLLKLLFFCSIKAL